METITLYDSYIECPVCNNFKNKFYVGYKQIKITDKNDPDLARIHYKKYKIIICQNKHCDKRWVKN